MENLEANNQTRNKVIYIIASVLVIVVIGWWSYDALYYNQEFESGNTSDVTDNQVTNIPLSSDTSITNNVESNFESIDFSQKVVIEKNNKFYSLANNQFEPIEEQDFLALDYKPKYLFTIFEKNKQLYYQNTADNQEKQINYVLKQEGRYVEELGNVV